MNEYELGYIAGKKEIEELKSPMTCGHPKMFLQKTAEMSYKGHAEDCVQPYMCTLCAEVQAAYERGLRDAAVAGNGTMDCPICGKDNPHSHSESGICRWLEAQGSRFGVKVRIFEESDTKTIQQYESGLLRFTEWFNNLSEWGVSYFSRKVDGYGMSEEDSAQFNAMGWERFRMWKAFQFGLTTYAAALAERVQQAVLEELKLTRRMTQAFHTGSVAEYFDRRVAELGATRQAPEEKPKPQEERSYDKTKQKGEAK